MSVASTCPACSLGDHARHDQGFGLMEGVIGGTYCDCKGDCAESFAAAIKEWDYILGDPA